MSAKSFSEIRSSKTRSLLEIIFERYGGSFQSALVVGCGSGHEASAVQKWFNSDVEGIDIDGSGFQPPATDKIKLKVMDAAALEYADNTFDLIYSFHAIEHIQDVESALNEMKRTLRPGGVFCIGTPNKSRLLGYIGSAQLLTTKIWWNLCDLGMRLRGKWDNSLGAHAGYTRSDLRELCSGVFGECFDITNDYYNHLYARRQRLLEKVVSLGIAERVFPAVYVIGRCKK